ncbi:MAG: tetrahydrofolate dehydrogenase/cyclohydrolase catalytic domain-containing protein, partial [Candidatus Paceibacteria bacterium]
LQLPIKLAAVLVGRDVGSIHYLKQKEKAAQRIGISFEVIQFPELIPTAALREKVLDISRNPQNTGIIVQLPLPSHIETAAILDSVPKEKDVDVLSEEAFGAFVDGHSKILPPVVGAIEFILERYNIEPRGKVVVIVGSGRLVGIPSMVWFSHQGSIVCLAGGRNADDISRWTRQADILVSGVGSPRLIKANMVKDGVVVLDAGYEVVNGRPVGDVDFESVASKASLITQVPGGIGPLTVAMVFRNLLTLARLQK